jgi:hypothetical protein
MFDLGPFASEEGARECWRSLGFLLPEKAKVFFDIVEGSDVLTLSSVAVPADPKQFAAGEQIR